MKFQGALITEQRVTFAIVIVKSHVLNNSTERDQMIGFGHTAFPGVPIILYDNSKYYGRKDIVGFLANISPSRIPWKEYTIS